MSRASMSRRVLVGVLMATALAGGGASSAPACGCGVLFRASAVSEKALVSWHDGLETIVPGLTIDRVQSHAAVVFPVPGLPRVRALPASVDIFAELEAATEPTRHGSPPQVGRGAPGASRPQVVSQKLIGGYEVSVLRGGNGRTLFAWLGSHAYRLRAAVKPLLEAYAAQHWEFVAIRLAHRGAGEIKPLAVAFRSARIVYPMKLSRVAHTPVSLELFVDAPAPVQAGGPSGLTRSFGGFVSELKPTPSKGVLSLLPEPYLTRVDADALEPAAIRSDIVMTMAPTVARSRHK